MNIWLWGCFALLLALVPCGAVALFYRKPLDRVIGLGLAAILVTLAIVAYSMGAHLASLLDLALTASVLGFGGSLVFVRFLERWE